VKSGTGSGLLLAVALLVAASVWLLSAAEAGLDVLIAVWLWSLPLLGLGALLGWAAGSLTERLLQKRTMG
jgi:hypothetical protein